MKRSVAPGAFFAVAMAALLQSAGCAGETGTLQVSVVTSPGSVLLGNATRLRVTLTSPQIVIESDRGPEGFSLSLDAPADGRLGALIVEAFGPSQELLAIGRSPPFPVGAISAEIRVFVAAPGSFSLAPVSLGSPRRSISTTPLSFGALLAGGRDADNAPVAALEVYNAYEHSLIVSVPLPAPRSGMAVIAGSRFAYLFGGLGPAGEPSGEFLRFDTRAAPVGELLSIANDPEFARHGQAMSARGGETFFVTGEPPLFVEGITGITEPLVGTPRLPPVIRSVRDPSVPNTPIVSIAVGQEAGTTGILQSTGAAFSSLGAPGTALRTGHALVESPAGDLIVVGGGDANGLQSDLIRIGPLRGRIEISPNALHTPRTGAAVSQSGSLAVIAGGRDAGGNIVSDAEVIDLNTLTVVEVIPLVSGRADCEALPLPNGQVAIFGGTDVNGNALSTIELFTPRDWVR